MLPSTWDTLLDDLRAFGARRQQRRAEQEDVRQRGDHVGEELVDQAAEEDAAGLPGRALDADAAGEHPRHARAGGEGEALRDPLRRRRRLPARRQGWHHHGLIRLCY